MDAHPHVHVLATGGTIANPPDRPGYIGGEELIGGVPELDAVADVTVEDVSSLGSSEMTPEVWFELHERIETLADEGVDGVVVTHGSNTMEETAYFLNLTLHTDCPVVLTAALRNRDTVGNDGDRNLLDAVRVAAHPDAAGRGVLVAVNDYVHQAREVTKTVSGRTDSWTSGDFGPVGLTDKRGRVAFYRRTERRHAPDTEIDVDGVDADDFFRVPIVYSAVGSDGSALRRELAADPLGVVLAALPTGTATSPRGRPSQTDVFGGDVPIVISQRGYQGWPNSAFIDRDDIVWADTLSPQKARVLLAVGLGNGHEGVDALQKLFLTY